MTHDGSGSLSSFVVAHQAAMPRQVEEALARQVLYGGDLITNLLEAIGPEGEPTLVAALAAYLGLAPAGAAVDGELPRAPQELLRRIPKEVALRYGFSPLTVRDGSVVVAVAEPLPPSAIQELTRALGQPLTQVVASLVRIRQALGRDYGLPLDRRTVRLLALLHGDAETMPSSLPPSFFFGALPPPSEPPPSSRPDALAAWVQTVRKDRERKPRRRGPLTLTMAQEALSGCAAANEVLELFFDFSRQYFLFSSLFLLSGDHALLFDAFGPGADPEPRARPPFALSEPNCLVRARNQGGPLCSPPAADGSDRKILHFLKRSNVATVFVLPLLLRLRGVALFYADDGSELLDLGQAGDVLQLAARTVTTLETIMLRRKRESIHEEGTSKTIVSGLPPSPSDAPPSAAYRLQGADVLVRALGLTGSTEATGSTGLTASSLPRREEETTAAARGDSRHDEDAVIDRSWQADPPVTDDNDV